MAAYEVVVYRSAEAFIVTEQVWRQFEAAQKTLHITQCYDWLRLWWEVFARREDQQFGFAKELLIIMVYKEGSLTAIAPLVKFKRKRYGINFSFLEFLGQQWGCAFIDIIGADGDQDIRAFLIAWLYSHLSFDVLNLSYIPESSKTLSLSGKHKVFTLSACPIIPVRDYLSYQDYENANCSKHHKHNLRTRMNRIVRDGLTCQYSVEQVSAERLQDVYRLSKSKLVDGKTSLYQDEDKRKFMLGAINRFTADAVFLSLNGRAAAYRLQLYFRDWKICVDASYDREFRWYGVGHLTVQESIKHSFNRRVGVHCEGAGNDDYKLNFTRQAIGIYDLIQAGNTLVSPLVFARLKAKRSGRKV